MTAVTVRAPVVRAWSRVWAGRNRYLVGAACVTICVFMLTPIVLSMLASVKTTAEASAVVLTDASTDRTIGVTMNTQMVRQTAPTR